MAERMAARITTIGAIDCDKAAREARRRENSRLRSEKRRRDMGIPPRNPAASLSRTKPWEQLGMSEATWYRKGKPSGEKTANAAIRNSSIAADAAPSETRGSAALGEGKGFGREGSENQSHLVPSGAQRSVSKPGPAPSPRPEGAGMALPHLRHPMPAGFALDDRMIAYARRCGYDDAGSLFEDFCDRYGPEGTHYSFKKNRDWRLAFLGWVKIEARFHGGSPDPRATDRQNPGYRPKSERRGRGTDAPKPVRGYRPGAWFNPLIGRWEAA
jgi:hypothetical protein